MVRKFISFTAVRQSKQSILVAEGAGAKQATAHLVFVWTHKSNES